MHKLVRFLTSETLKMDLKDMQHLYGKHFLKISNLQIYTLYHKFLAHILDGL